MAITNSQRVVRRRFDSREQEAYLALWRTYDRLRLLEDELFVEFELTAQQYNLAERLVSRAPDITRMLDRLEERGLIARSRSTNDRRAVLVTIRPAGLALLDRIAGPLRQCHQRQLGHLSAAELESLIALLRSARAPHESPNSPWI
jgi:DNA-binding MarR family transcriptional regulator